MLPTMPFWSHIREVMKIVWELLKETITEWNEDKAPMLAAALAFYTILSLSPLLVIVIAIAGLIFGESAAQEELIGQIRDFMGTEMANSIQGFIQRSSKPSGNIIAMIIGIVTLVLGSSLVFKQMKDALNVIWNVPANVSRGVKGMVLDRLIAFLMVVGAGLLLLLSLLANAILTGLSASLNEAIPESVNVWQYVNGIISLGLITVIFAIIFKVLPDVRVRWRDVWVGAAVTSVLFNISKFLIGLYLGHSSLSSTYGAAGSLVLILLWVYYAAQIFLFGAEFTQVYTRKSGAGMVFHTDTTEAEKAVEE